MRQTLLGIAVAIALVSAGATSRAQTWRSFDQDLEQKPGVHMTLCDKDVPAPEDGSLPDAIGWQLDYAELDIKIENSEFDALRASAEKHGKAEGNAFNSLVNAFESYKKQHLDIDTIGCGGGNGCPADITQEEAQVNYDFLLMAEGFRGAGFPVFSASEAEKADAALNAAYKQNLSNFPVQCQQTGYEICVTLSEYRNMERAWIRYRDAWVTYGAIRWPKVTADSWRGYLTKQHTEGPAPGDINIGGLF